MNMDDTGNTERILGTVADLGIEFEYNQQRCDSIMEDLYNQVGAIVLNPERHMQPKAILVGQKTYIYLCCYAGRSRLFPVTRVEWLDYMDAPIAKLPIFLAPDVDDYYLQVVSEPSTMFFHLHARENTRSHR